MSFQITRTLLVHGSYAALLQPLLHDYAQATRREPDCDFLRLYQHQADAQVYLLEGQWRNEIAYLSHLDQPHHKHFLHLVSSMLLAPYDYFKLLPIML
jgi:quinol monooxygenase YgiN